MSRRPPHRCPYCFETVPYGGPQMMPLDIVEPRCAVTLRWHMACAHVDPLFAEFGEFADVEVEPSAEVDPFRDVYHKVLDRTAARDVALLPAVVDVRRDIDEVRPDASRVTLRAHGASWGRPTVVTHYGARRRP